MMATAFIVFAHGSSVESANDAVRAVADQAARRAAWDAYRTAFLGGGRPSLAEAVDDLVRNGAVRCVVIPYFLTLGLHLERDLPALVDEIRTAHPNLEIEVTAPLDGHPALLDAVLDRAKESECRRG
jgi:sirohydrochlorin ferrochelatase